MIEGLLFNGRWSDSVEEVKRGINDHFEHHFRASVSSRPHLLIDIFPRSIDTCSNHFFTASITEEEVKAVVWACDSDKSPSPDRYSFGFIKECWEELKGEILELMSERRLAKWKDKNLSLGGRITLIQSVPSVIPIYCLSFYRIPKLIVKEVTSIHRDFLSRRGEKSH
ncbi:hypothetical protein ACS0TY_004874 [Phlomoides rotata]